MAEPILAALSDAPMPRAITRGGAPILDMIAANPFLARHMGRPRCAPARPTAVALPALALAATALLIRLAQDVTTVGGLLLVAAIGAAAWCGADAMARTPPPGGRTPANDNPSRPCLPPHARW